MIYGRSENTVSKRHQKQVRLILVTNLMICVRLNIYLLPPYALEALGTGLNGSINPLSANPRALWHSLIAKRVSRNPSLTLG